MKIPDNATVRQYVVDALMNMTSGKVIAAIAGKEFVKVLNIPTDVKPLANIFINVFGALLAAESERALFGAILSDIARDDKLDQASIAKAFHKIEAQYSMYGQILDGVTTQLAGILQDPKCEFHKNLRAAERFAVLSIVKLRYYANANEDKSIFGKLASSEFIRHAFVVDGCFEDELLGFVDAKQDELWDKSNDTLGLSFSRRHNKSLN